MFTVMVAVGCGKGPYDEVEQKPAEVVSEGAKQASTPGLTVSESDLHAPFYPGAAIDSGTSMKVKSDTEESALVFMTSSDEIEQIKKFYEEKVTGMAWTGELGAGSISGQAQVDGGALSIKLQSLEKSVKITAEYTKRTTK